jgi:hypothetical protein
MNVSLGQMVSTIATSLIVAGVGWISNETIKHDVTLQRIEDKQITLEQKSDSHDKTLGGISTQLSDPATGIHTKLNYLNNGFIGLTTKLTGIQEQRDREQVESKARWDKVLNRLNQIDGEKKGSGD